MFVTELQGAFGATVYLMFNIARQPKSANDSKQDQ